MIKFIKKHIIEVLFSGIFILISVVLNLQFLNGSNINTIIAGHDEYIAVKEVYGLLSPESLKHFLMAILSGSVLFYGRLMFYFDALIAYIPFLIWGVKGMVLCIRLTHAFILLISLLILSKTFLKYPMQKAFFFMGIFCLYYTMYFIMMPKPEPHQILCLAIFFNYFKRKNWSFGWHFIFVGLAYGLKFNVLLIMPILFLMPFFSSTSKDWKLTLKGGIVSFLYFIIGVLIAIPCLILSPIKPIFLRTYLHETFGGTDKMYDNSNLNVLDWMNSGLGGSYLGMSFLSYLFIAVVVATLIVGIKKANRSKDFSSTILLLSGLLLTVVIMLKTKRLWPHYLWTAYVMMLLGLCISAFESRHLKFNKGLKVILMIFVMSSTYFYLKRELPLYRNLESNNIVQANFVNDSKAIEYVKSKFSHLKIGTDGSVLYPFEDFVAVDIFHPFQGRIQDRTETPFRWFTDAPEKIWEASDVAVFRNRFPPKMLKENTNVYNGRHEELNALYLKQLEHNFTKDTSFGDVHIFIKRHE